MNDKINVTPTVLTLLKNSIPELNNLFEKLSVEWFYANNNEPVEMQCVFSTVHFNDRITRLFWVGAFVAWEGFYAESSSFKLHKFEKLITVFEDIKNVSDYESVNLNSIPTPGSTLESLDVEIKAVSHFACFSAAWSLLHELKHILIKQDCGNKLSKHNEELLCDKFATQILLNSINDYAEISKDQIEHVITKRKIGIIFAGFSLLLMSKDNWGQSESHPEMQQRLNQIEENLNIGPNKIEGYLGKILFEAAKKIMPNCPSMFDSYEVSDSFLFNYFKNHQAFN